MPQTTNHNKRWIKVVPFAIITLVIISLCCICTFTFFAVVSGLDSTSGDAFGEQDYTYYSGKKGGAGKILSIKIEGIIEGTEPDNSDFFSSVQGVTYGYTIKEQLYKATNNPEIQGVILEINSPGGTIYGSQAISDGIEYYKQKTGNPVFAHISGISASGAYWVASATDTVLADNGSLIGSIGVIFGPIDYYNKVLSTGSILGAVVTQNGIEQTYITAGRSKDIGNPFRRMTQEEVAVLQQGVNSLYEDFVSHVAKHRKLSPQTIKSNLGALIFENKAAINNKLIDGTANRQEAYIALARKAELNNLDFEIVRVKNTGSLLNQLFEVALRNNTQPNVGLDFAKMGQVCGANASPLLLYGSPEMYCK